ncbi:Hypothetical protein PAU_03839 [Photorhabdus asymbiotica]|uniref:Uncharacterized protein n=1 Tax=Photorhabdus asymbiotica subsp. asymbiotica (strain ATCC 43949 / 3105-77) TaxID=553480 RepID=C7BMP8_PHOAA|nr:Hypothetical protein PAU_03839 [Photorhabdus asymbiotica]
MKNVIKNYLNFIYFYLIGFCLSFVDTCPIIMLCKLNFYLWRMFSTAALF